MKTQKGITMVSLVIYVASFFVVAGIIGAITTYFYQNMKIMDTSVGSAAEYNKLNVYFLKQTKEAGVTIQKYDGSEEKGYITFLLPDGKKNTFVKLGNCLYFNQIKLCDNINKFKVTVNDGTEKKSIRVYVEISNRAYQTDYVLKENEA